MTPTPDPLRDPTIRERVQRFETGRNDATDTLYRAATDRTVLLAQIDELHAVLRQPVLVVRQALLTVFDLAADRPDIRNVVTAALRSDPGAETIQPLPPPNPSIMGKDRR